MARVDFFVNDKTEEIYFNELNTLPGFTSISMYPKLWQSTGLTYPDLLDELICIARTHHQCRQHLVTDYL
jgi:D-alanine-D-alanine ligase